MASDMSITIIIIIINRRPACVQLFYFNIFEFCCTVLFHFCCTTVLFLVTARIDGLFIISRTSLLNNFGITIIKFVQARSHVGLGTAAPQKSALFTAIILRRYA